MRFMKVATTVLLAPLVLCGLLAGFAVGLVAFAFKAGYSDAEALSIVKRDKISPPNSTVYSTPLHPNAAARSDQHG